MRSILVIVASLLAATSASAQESEWRVALRAVSLGHEASPCVVADTGAALETGRTVGGQIEGEYMVTDQLGIAFSLTAGPLDLDGVGDSLGGESGARFWFVPVTLTMRYELPLRGGFTPYAGVGIHGSFLGAVSVEDALEDLGIQDIDTDPGFGATGELGLTYDIGQDHFVTVQATYLDFTNDLTFRDADGASLGTSELSGSSWSFALGYGWRY
jgi:outer membrane protein W